MIKFAEERCLQAIFNYRGLTTEQVTHLLYNHGSLTYVRTKLKELTQQKYLARFQNPSPTGSSPFVYTPGTLGLRYLEANGIDLNGFTPLKEKGKERTFYYFLNHLLGLNDFMISASLLPAYNTDATVQRLETEWRIKSKPLGRIVPDGFLDFKVLVGAQKRPYQIPIWVEYDNNTEFGRNFKEKLRDIVGCVVNGSYQERFGVENMTVAFPTPVSETRRDLMRRHVFSVLQDMNALQYAELFLCAHLTYETHDAEGNRMKWFDSVKTFVQPLWYSCTSNNPLPLLDFSD